MKARQGGFTEILIVVVILVAAVAAGAYYFGRGTNQPQSSAGPTASPATNQDETANWKTHSGKHFSFKFPSDWEVVPSYSGPSYEQTLENATVKGSSGISFSVIAVKDDFYWAESQLPSKEVIKVDNREAIMIDMPPPVSNINPSTTHGRRIIVKGSKIIGNYILLFSWDESKGRISETLINQILSTVKFLD